MKDLPLSISEPRRLEYSFRKQEQTPLKCLKKLKTITSLTTLKFALGILRETKNSSKIRMFVLSKMQNHNYFDPVLTLVIQTLILINLFYFCMTEPDKKIKPQDIQKFVRKKINFSYNEQLFNEQLNSQIQTNLVRIQENLVKDMKRKMILKNQQQMELQKRQKLKRELQMKLTRSKSKREKQLSQAQRKMSEQNKYRKQILLQRLNQIKKQEVQKTEKKLKEIQQKSKVGGPTYNKISRSVSLIQEPHYKKKLQISQSSYNKLKSIVQQKSAFKGSKIEKRQLSLSNIHPRQGIYGQLQAQRINKLGQHLQRIEQTRKKRQNLINQRIKSNKQLQKYANIQKQQKLKLLMQQQKQRQQNIVAKLSKSVIPNSNIFARNSSRISNNAQSPIKKQVKGSIMYEQSQSRQKHSYRRQIKQQIRQYMMNQKQKLLNS